MVYYANGTTVDDEAERQAEFDLAMKLYQDPEVRALLDALSPGRKAEREALLGRCSCPLILGKRVLGASSCAMHGRASWAEKEG